ncbi:MAG: FtsX-like permease family protein [Candidatus Heimdallarchaeota archaeon]|nr:FtsX-like permease family protein [Candidatus Heimdallarchaeota archaeon]
MSKNSIKLGYLISFAFKNVLNHKRHMLIIIFSFTISVSVLLSVNTWSNSSEHLAINDFLESQDFQAYIYSPQRPEEVREIEEGIKDNPLVNFYTSAHTTFALFNTEDKSEEYRCLPEYSQQNSTNPVSITNAFLANQSTLDSISFMFNFEGNFTVENNGILLSLFQLDELSTIYGRKLTIGDRLNVSIAKYLPNPAYGQNMISSFRGTYFDESYVIRGIYTISDGISVLQSAVPIEVLSDSVIFNSNLLSQTDINIMEHNDIPYILFVKFSKDEITKDGLNQVLDKMHLFAEQIKKDYPTVYIFTLDSPLVSLMNAYTRANVSIVFMIPIIMTSIILTIFTINIVIKSRESEVALLRDRGADTFQIMLIYILEFIIVAFIGTILGIALSFPIAAMIPSFNPQGFSLTTYNNFISHPIVNYWFLILVPFILTIVIIGYACVKIYWEISLKHKNADHEKSDRRKIERNLVVGITIGLIFTTLILSIFSLIDTIEKINNTRNYSISGTTSAGYTFLLFCLLLTFISQGLSLFITKKIQSNLKGFFKRIVFTNAFFLNNSFKRKDKKLNTMTFSLLIVSSIIVFTLISMDSVITNQQIEADFKNGADLRISTYPIDYSFESNISKINGVNEVVPVFKTKGSIAYNNYLVYGIDPIIYSRIGKWDASCFPDGYSLSNLQELDETPNGVIISLPLAMRLNITIGDNLPVNSLPGSTYNRIFSIVGIINAAPGLGLADGANIEMLQPETGFILINDNYIQSTLKINTCQLFLASIFPGENLEEIETHIEGLLPNIIVNPKLINERFIGAFIESYIPNVRIFFYIMLIAILLIIFILLIMFTEFTLNQRSQEFAIKMSLGGSRQMISKHLIVEITIIVLNASIIGIFLGIGFTYATFQLIVPLLTSHNIIPFNITIPPTEIIIFPILITLVAVIGVLPSIIKHGGEKIIETLRS